MTMFFYTDCTTSSHPMSLVDTGWSCELKHRGLWTREQDLNSESFLFYFFRYNSLQRTCSHITPLKKFNNFFFFSFLVSPEDFSDCGDRDLNKRVITHFPLNNRLCYRQNIMEKKGQKGSLSPRGFSGSRLQNIKSSFVRGVKDSLRTLRIWIVFNRCLFLST